MLIAWKERVMNCDIAPAYLKHNLNVAKLWPCWRRMLSLSYQKIDFNTGVNTIESILHISRGVIPLMSILQQCNNTEVGVRQL